MPVFVGCVDQVDLWRYSRSAAWPCLDSPHGEPKRYPSDLSDERWALIEPVITAWKAAHQSVSGHQGGYEKRRSRSPAHAGVQKLGFEAGDALIEEAVVGAGGLQLFFQLRAGRW